MPTMQAVVTKAYKRLGVIGLGETPSNEQLNDGNDALNEMMHGWKAEGVDTEHTTTALGGTFPLGDEYVSGVIAMLAARMAGENGYQIDPILAGSAEAGWLQLQAAYVHDPDLKAGFDDVLTNMPSQRLLTA